MTSDDVVLGKQEGPTGRKNPAAILDTETRENSAVLAFEATEVNDSLA